MTDDRRVIIVGAGPVGLVTALRLAGFGIPSLVLEKIEGIPPELRATTFHPPTLDMLDDLGVASCVIAQGVVTSKWQVLHLPTNERAEFDLSVLQGETRHPFRLQCEQFKLASILFEEALASDLIEIVSGAEVTHVEQNDTMVAAIARISGECRRFEGTYLVGADGARSVVRETLRLPLEGSTYPSVTILLTTPYRFEDVLPHLLGANYIWGGSDSFSMFRLRDEWRCTFYPRPGETDELALTEAAVQERLNGIVARSEPYEVGERRTYRIHQRIVPDYRVGRIVLAGDAAHLNAPTGGMGMNGGIHDAVNLSGKLARILRGESEELLDLYTRQRRLVAEEEILKQSHQNRTRMQQRNPADQLRSLREMQAIAGDPVKLMPFLLRTSMIAGLRRADAAT